MITIDQDTKDMLNVFDFKSLHNVSLQETTDQQQGRNQRPGGNARRAAFQ
jgi:hypothetical protein